MKHVIVKQNFITLNTFSATIILFFILNMELILLDFNKNFSFCYSFLFFKTKRSLLFAS